MKMFKQSIALFVALCMLLPFFPDAIYAAPGLSDLATSLTEEFVAMASANLFEGTTADDLQQILDDELTIYQEIRIQSDNTGTRTHRVPVQAEEIEYLIEYMNTDGDYIGITPFSIPFPYQRIMGAGLNPADSIVIMLFSDGFAANQWNAALTHANNAINAMLSTHPFGLFEDMFIVYLIHAYGNNPNTGHNGYLGTIAAPGGTCMFGNPAFGGEISTSSTVRQVRIRELANAIVPANQQTMIQVISNAIGGTGFAWIGWHYLLSVNISVTSLRIDVNPQGGSNTVWPNGTAWQGTFIHEFGHSFGGLLDEHGDHSFSQGELRANATQAADAAVKWQHWAGHRNVLATPTRFFAGVSHPGTGVINAANNWAIPTHVSWTSGQSGCLMRASWGNRNFCGVCTAELIRRSAIISGEMFLGRSPSTVPPINSPVLHPTVTVPVGATRILDSAFHGNTNLTTITIPPSVTSIGDFAFIGTTSLSTIINFTTTPQTLNATTFTGVDRATVDVFIPIGTYQAFRDAGWTVFNLIEAGITLSGNITGSTGAALVGTQQVTVTLQGDTFANSLTGNWITNLPNGLTQSVARINNTTAIITVSGTPTTTSNAQAAVTIPAGALALNSGVSLVATPGVGSVFSIANLVPVTGITVAPSTGTVGTAVTLTGTVAPTTATNQTITWSLGAGSTAAGAAVTGNQATATGPGTVVVVATIANGTAVGTPFTTTHTVTFSNAFVAVTAVNVSPLTTIVQRGHQRQFTATVVGTNSPPQGVIWSLSGNVNAATTISSSGLLTIASNETATNITVIATSTFNMAVFGVATVTVTTTPPINVPTPTSTPTPTSSPDHTPTQTPPPSRQVTVPANNNRVDVPINVANNLVTFQLPTTRINSLVNTAVNDTVSFNLTGIANASAVNLPRAAMRQFGNADLAVHFQFANGTIVFDGAAVADIGRQARTANVTVSFEPIGVNALTAAQREASAGSHAMYRVTVMSGTTPITDINGFITVTMQWDGTPVTVWHMNELGVKVRVDAVMDTENNRIIFTAQTPGIFIVNTAMPELLLRFVIGQRHFTQRGIAGISDAAPFMTNNRAMVPLRIIADALGAEVYWDGATRSVDIFTGERTLTLSIGVPLPDGMGTPVIINGRTFVPARYVSEILGATVRWDPERAAVYVYQQ